jgi:hypothetical protein
VRRPVVAIHQPNLLPWLGWFAKAAQADVLVLLDDVQLERASPTTRVGFKTREGVRMLTVPVRRGEDVRIDAAEIAHDGKWDAYAARVLELAYRESPGWSRHGAAVVECLRSREPRLAAFNERGIQLLFGALGVATRVEHASKLGPRTERGNFGNVEICRRLGAGTYLSGSGGRKYNDPATFAAAGIDLAYSAFAHPVHAQPHGAFAAGLSAVDVLFSAPDEAASLLRAGIGAPTAQ